MNAATRLVISAIAFVAAYAPQSRAQSPEAFDVASVKVNTIGGQGYPGLAPGGTRFTATNLPLTALIMLAYDATPRQISGVPSSLNAVGYDIEAKCDHPMTKDQASRMLQTLLADRFKLSLHREVREQQIYALVVGKNGAKLHESPPESALWSRFSPLHSRRQRPALQRHLCLTRSAGSALRSKALQPL